MTGSRSAPLLRKAEAYLALVWPPHRVLVKVALPTVAW